jgi:NADH-quinone oxidoreductase subunit N
MVEQVLDSLSGFLPEVSLVAAFCLALLATLLLRKRPAAVSAVTLAGLGAAGVFAVAQIGEHRAVFSGMIVVDPFAVFFKLVVLLAVVLIVLFSFFSTEVQQTRRRMGEYFSLLLAMTLGMFLMVSSVHLLMIVLAVELTSLSSYVLAGYTKEARDSSEASLKYIIYGALSTGVMLYGMSLLYGLTGSLDLFKINAALMTGGANPVTLMLSVVLILVGFGYKISAVPFHFWTPDVYEGAPITITALLSVASKAAGFALMIRFFKTTFIDAAVTDVIDGFWTSVGGLEWNLILAVVSVLTMTLGNLVAVWQDNLKRLLAYSSIAHAGYMLMGVVLLSDAGIAAVLIYFVVYLFMNLGAFYVVMLVAGATGSEDINDYRGLGSRSPLLGVAMVIFFISLTGLPPTAGFIGKLYLFAALLDARWVWLAVVGALNSVVSLYYYVRVLRNMFLRDAEGSRTAIRVSVPQTVILLLLLIPTLVLGLYFAPLVDLANASVAMFGLQ